MKDNVEVFLMGDFNINWKDKKSPMVKELDLTTSLWGLKAMFRDDTRIGVSMGEVKGSCIDNIFTNSEFILKARILNWNYSDHLVVAVKRKRQRVTLEKVEFEGRSYKNYVREELQRGLVQEDWRLFYEARDPSECWEILEVKLRGYLDKTCPIKKFKVKEAREPWVTNEILEQIKDKDRALRIARNSGKIEDWKVAKSERNRVGRLIDEAKAEFLKEQQVELVDDPKKFWRLVKTIVPDKVKKSRKISLKKETTMVAGAESQDENVSDKETAGFINNFFSNIGPNLANNFHESWEFYGENIREGCPDLDTDYEQVRLLCRDIKTCKSSGIDGVSTRVFKDAFRVLVPQLVFLFNLSFELGKFPDKWKSATIIPLYKGGDKTDVSNYRPVSLLPLPGKLIEKVVHAKMSKFLEQHSILTEKQGGFREGFSTSKSVAELTDRIFEDINKGYTSLAVFVDLRKAFDKVDHGILLKKLHCYGFRGKILDWCGNYLSDRSQRTLANGYLSDRNKVSCGVPQGSVLGPLFFILYVNDMQFAVKGANIQLYADDTVIFASGKDVKQTVEIMQPLLNKFYKWCLRNKLSLNTGKTKQMFFGTRQRVKKAKGNVLLINGTQIQAVPTYKYLGLTLDSTLSFAYHVKSVMSMVAYKTHLLSKIRRYMTEEVALKIYKSMIIPYFDYGDVIYGCASNEGLDKIQRLQNRCLKICKNYNARFHTRALHLETGFPSLSARRIAHVNNFMFSRLSDKSKVDVRDIPTRAHDAPLFRVKIPALEAYKRSVEYRGSIQWNQLSGETRGIDDVKVFKKDQKRKMLSSIPDDPKLL